MAKIKNPLIVMQGGGRAKWSRPTAWGQYPSEFQAEKALPESQKTMQAIYLLYHHNTTKYGTIVNFAGFKATITGGYTVERGHMSGSTFVTDLTTQVASSAFYIESFTDSMPEYIVYRIKPQTSGSEFTAFAFGHTDSDLNAVPQRMIETYGRVKLSLVSSIKVSATTIHIDLIAYGTVTSMQGLFYNSRSLESLDCSDWDTSATTNMSSMFSNCYALESLDCSGWDTSAVTDMSAMFQSRYALESLDCSGWDTSAVTNMSNLFGGCVLLSEFHSPTFRASVSLSYCNLLRHDSLMSIINNLATVSTAQTLTLGSANLAKLTTAEKQIATQKGWTLA